MMDTTVTVCKGILLDSEAGPGGIIYGNNEDFTFTIDAGGVITLVFSPVFCTETNLDVLTFHDGPTIGSPQIGPPYSGSVAPPPIVATSGFLTVHFVSDINVAYCGWEATWTTVVPPPVPPMMSVPTPPVCNSSVINVQFSSKVHCDSIATASFSLLGGSPPPAQVINAVPTGCVADSTTTAQITVNEPFDENCPFTLQFTLGLADRCDSVWYFTLNAGFTVTTCPVEVTIVANTDTICAGTCATLTAVVNSCQGATYVWSNGLPASAGPHVVCPTSTTMYTVTATENGTGNAASTSFTIVVQNPNVLTPDQTICQSASAISLSASPAGGIWNGPGVIDTLAGIFHPDTAGPGTHAILYTLGGCDDAVVITVDSIDAGHDEAACPGALPFTVCCFGPAGGTWSGPFINAAGVFDPSTPGSYVVIYAQGNCTDTKTINVDTIVGPTITDTICQSVVPFDIPVSPFGGIWTGAGVVDSLYGTFDADEAGGGTHVLTYTLHGCLDQFMIEVIPIQAGLNNQSACPSQAPFLITPAAVPSGGIWSGLGIIDVNTGLYDPGLAGGGGNVNDELIYAHPNGCTDTMYMFVRWTVIGVDTFFMCLDDPPLNLDAFPITGRVPCCGVWTGPGIAYLGGIDYALYPAVAGVGVHTIVYDKNTCSDTATVIIYPAGLGVADMTVCTTTAPFLIEAMPPGAAFVGPGVADPFSGVFDPAAAGPGVHEVYYWSPAWCIDSINITVYPFAPAQIGGVLPTYCSNSTTVDISLSPAGGAFSGLPDTLFDPSTLAPGTYTLIYSLGSGDCFTSDTLVFENHPPLTTVVTTTPPVICGGGGAMINVQVSGGDPGVPTQFIWSDGLFPVATQNVSPSATHTYWVMTFDGCSEPVVDSITIGVFPAFTPVFTLSDTSCHGEPGSVSASVPGGGAYTFTWGTSPPQTGSSINAPAGQSFVVTTVNDVSGCDHDTLITVPGWPPIVALFSTNPNEPCVPFDQSDVTFIDLSNNAVGGEWTINGITFPYVPGQNPDYDLGTPGAYDAQLVVYNIGGCVDTFALSVCILDPTPVFVPDAFSPNGDGSNDILFVRGPGIVEMGFTVWDRWGAKVFESQSPDHGWDGNRRGAQMPSGVYVYVLSAVLNDGERIALTGDVTLVR